MRAALPLLFALLGACATSAKGDGEGTANAPEPLSLVALSPQALAPGECGLFGWTDNSRFVFFATATRGAYAADGRVIALAPRGEFPARDYGEAQLDLGTPEAMDGGTRYPYARIKQLRSDGFTSVRPLILVEACQTPDAPF